MFLASLGSCQDDAGSRLVLLWSLQTYECSAVRTYNFRGIWDAHKSVGSIESVYVTALDKLFSWATVEVVS